VSAKQLVRFGDIMHMEKGKKPKQQFPNKKEGYLPYVDIKAFETGVVDSFTDGNACVPCDVGDILIVRDGSRSGLVGKAIKGYVGSTLAIITAKGLTQDYLYYFLQGKYEVLNTRKKGTGTPHLDPELLAQQRLIVPDIAVQKRIVAKIEELFSELDKAVEAMETIQQQLAVYRQAVLKDVFGGDKHSDSFGKHVVSMQNGISKRNSDAGKDTIVLRLADVDNDSINEFSPKRTIKLDWEERKRYLLSTGDLLLIRVNGSVDRVGRAIQVKEDCLYAFCDHFIRCTVNTNSLLPEFAKWLLHGPEARTYIENNLVSTAGQNTINQTTIKNIPVFIPNLIEQEKILESIKSRLSVCDSIEQTVSAALRQAAALRQSILKQAFEGKLIS
jgi:type I restriction enzyme S subunit